MVGRTIFDYATHLKTKNSGENVKKKDDRSIFKVTAGKCLLTVTTDGRGKKQVQSSRIRQLTLHKLDGRSTRKQTKRLVLGKLEGRQASRQGAGRGGRQSCVPSLRHQSSNSNPENGPSSSSDVTYRLRVKNSCV